MSNTASEEASRRSQGVAEVIGDKREEILRLASQHGARHVRVFGSVARGEAGPDSDVDLLVDIGPKTSPWFPGGLVADLEDLLERRVDIAEPSTLHRLIREQVLKEAMPL